MTRRAALLTPAVVLIVGGVLLPAVAHPPDSNNAGAPGVPADPDAPRRISEQTARIIGLRTAEVDFGRADAVVRLTGIVRAMPERTHIVTSAVAGTLMRLDARLGQRVRRGQTLGTVQSADLARLVTELHKAEIDYEHAGVEVSSTGANITQLRNQITVSEAQAVSLEAEYARAQAGGEAIAANVLSNRKNSAQQARSQVGTLKISMETAERTLGALEKIRAATTRSIDSMRDAIEIIHAHPAGIDLAAEAREEGESGGTFLLHAAIDGVVVRRDGVPGQGLEAGKPILTIVDDSEMLIEGDLPESMIAGFAARLAAAPDDGSEVRIRRAGAAAGDPPIAVGRVVGISPTVDPIKRTAHLLVSAKNTAPAQSASGATVDPASTVAPRPTVPSALQEGMFVSLAVVEAAGDSDTARAVAIPASAILTDGPISYVFVREKDAYVKRPILTGPRDDRVVEVREGLVPGDIIVTQGAYLLSQVR